MKRSYEDPTYISFFILGGLWIVQFCLTFIFIIADSGKHLNSGIGSGMIYGIVHIVALLFAAGEDLRYGTHHLKWIIILAVVMNFIMYYIAYLGVIAILAVVIAVCFGGYLLVSGAPLVAGFLIGGGSVGTIIILILGVGAIVAGMLGMSAAW